MTHPALSWTDPSPALRTGRLRRRDLSAVEAMWDRCSPDTLSRRFLGGNARPSWLIGGGPALRAPRVDLGAWAGHDLVGVGSLVCDGVESWEPAMVVEDAWQGRGVGTLLAEVLAGAARAYGVGTLVLTTPADAVAVLRLVRRHARTPELVWAGSGVAEWRVVLGRGGTP